MQTTIALDDELIERAQKLTGVETKSEAVQAALRAFISSREQADAGSPRADAPPQAAVVESLERSLIENAEIWSELAKH